MVGLLYTLSDSQKLKADLDDIGFALFVTKVNKFTVAPEEMLIFS